MVFVERWKSSLTDNHEAPWPDNASERMERLKMVVKASVIVFDRVSLLAQKNRNRTETRTSLALDV